MFDSEYTSVLPACSSGFFRNISLYFIVRKSEIGFLLVGARIGDIILLILQNLQVIKGQFCCLIETSQVIFCACHLTGFYMMGLYARIRLSMDNIPHAQLVFTR